MNVDTQTSLIIGAAIVAAAFVLKPEKQVAIGRYQTFSSGSIAFVLDTSTGARWIATGAEGSGLKDNAGIRCSELRGTAEEELAKFRQSLKEK